MTPELALQWLSWTIKQPLEVVENLGLTDAQLLFLGVALADNKLLNPPAEKPLKIGTFTCACGCGLKFRREYRTKKPKYMNEAHKKRAYRERVRLRDVVRARRI